MSAKKHHPINHADMLVCSSDVTLIKIRAGKAIRQLEEMMLELKGVVTQAEEAHKAIQRICERLELKP